MIYQNIALVEAIGYEFSDMTLLQRAVTHRSHSSRHNERLEFLGDAVLGMCMAEKLFADFPHAKEGQLSRMRASLVKGSTLSELATQMNIGEHIRLGPGEMKSGGHRRESILEDVMEAIIGAIYCDGGIAPCRELIARWFKQYLDKLDVNHKHQDDKSQLQEWLQGRGYPLPQYTLVKTEGQDHDQTFFVMCESSDLGVASEASGKSRKAAEQIAAQRLLGKISSL